MKYDFTSVFTTQHNAIELVSCLYGKSQILEKMALSTPERTTSKNILALKGKSIPD